MLRIKLFNFFGMSSPSKEVEEALEDTPVQQRQPAAPPPSSSIHPPPPSSSSETHFHTVDYHLYRGLKETDAAAFDSLQFVVESSWKDSDARPTFGRLYTRAHLVALWRDVLNLTTVDAAITETATELTTLPADDPDLWHALSEHFVALRVMMARRDANVLVMTKENDQQQDATPMVELEEYDMFTDQYQDLLLRLQVQHCLARLRKALQGVQLQVQEEETRKTQGAGRAYQQLSPIRLFEEAVQDYQEGLNKAFAEHERAIPTQLERFARNDLLLRKDQDPVSVAASLLKVIDKCRLNGGGNENEADYTSLSNLKEMMHSLLIQWSDCVFDVPVLERSFTSEAMPAEYAAGVAAETTQAVAAAPFSQDMDDDDEHDDDDMGFVGEDGQHGERAAQRDDSDDEEEEDSEEERDSGNVQPPRSIVRTPHTLPRSETKRKGGTTPSAKTPKYLAAAEEIFDSVGDATQVNAGYVFRRLEQEPYFFSMSPGKKKLVIGHLGLLIKEREGTPGVRESVDEEDDDDNAGGGDRTPLKRRRDQRRQRVDNNGVTTAVEPSSKRRKTQHHARADVRKKIDWSDEETEGELEDSPFRYTASGHKTPTKTGEFSEEEVRAVRKAERDGLISREGGKWASLPKLYRALSQRTGVQIRDWYRNRVGRETMYLQGRTERQYGTPHSGRRSDEGR